MDKVLRPDKLEVDAQTPDAAAIYEFWERSLKNLIQSSFAEATEEEKLFVLIQYLTYRIRPSLSSKKQRNTLKLFFFSKSTSSSQRTLVSLGICYTIESRNQMSLYQNM